MPEGRPEGPAQLQVERVVTRRGVWGITILDLAEGGIRCLAPQMVPIEPGEPIEVAFDFDGLGVGCPAGSPDVIPG